MLASEASGKLFQVLGQQNATLHTPFPPHPRDQVAKWDGHNEFCHITIQGSKGDGWRPEDEGSLQAGILSSAADAIMRNPVIAAGELCASDTSACHLKAVRTSP